MRTGGPSNPGESGPGAPREDSGLFGAWTPPERIGRFTIVRQLDERRAAATYVARDPDRDREVVVRLLDSQPATTQKAALLREAHRLAALSHPSLVPAVTAGSWHERVFLVTELVEAPTLRAWLERERRDVREILDVFAQAGRGLAAAHAAGVVHRDFKPDNVHVCDGGRVLVGNFSLARMPAPPVAPSDESTTSAEHRLLKQAAVEPITVIGGALGTPAYMAPEQHLGRPADARSDQFAFCVALFEALYGHRPFEGETLEEVADAILRGAVREPEHRAGVPAHVERAVRRGLASDPRDRHPSMNALLAELTARPRSRARWLLLALLLAAAAAAALLRAGAP